MTVKGMRSLKRKLNNMQDMEDDAASEVREHSAKAAVEAKKEVAEGNNIWTMNLWRSIYYTEKPTPKGTRFEVLADAPYARFVEFGTGSRWGTGGYSVPDTIDHYSSPPLTGGLINDIRSWVFTKPYFVGPRSEAMAQAIAHSIAEHGTHAHPFMRPAWFRTKPFMLADVEKAVRMNVRRG